VQAEDTQQEVAQIERPADFQVQEDAEELPHHQLLLIHPEEERGFRVPREQAAGPRDNKRSPQLHQQ